MFDPRPLYCSSLTTAVGGTLDINLVDSAQPTVARIIRSVGYYEFWISNLLLEILVLILFIRNGFSRLYYFRFTFIFELVHWHYVKKTTLGQCVERVIRLLFL